MALLGGILLILLGFLGVKFPAFIWYISIGWQFRDSEPSDIAIGINRFIGYFIIVTGVCFIIDFFFPTIG
ncbi:DUF6199 family natural product biosynthesis protein [Bacillus salitolerans]|uniref:DUF6199 family natural product biosynthesis protein n=1 Tax=Bacillus salitolerans TaxID=1437434 RepID=A0ABW4LRX1_9BACI